MQPLTEEQRKFAEENHNLIFSFLSRWKLDTGFYYDIAAFGFLTAVQQYMENKALSERYKFSTIAFLNMKSRVIAHWKKERRRHRIAAFSSLEEPIPGTNHLYAKDILESKKYNTCDEAVSKLAYKDFIHSITPKQRAALERRVAGYKTREIADQLNVTASCIAMRLAKARDDFRRQL